MWSWSKQLKSHYMLVELIPSCLCFRLVTTMSIQKSCVVVEEPCDWGVPCCVHGLHIRVPCHVGHILQIRVNTIVFFWFFLVFFWKVRMFRIFAIGNQFSKITMIVCKPFFLTSLIWRHLFDVTYVIWSYIAWNNMHWESPVSLYSKQLFKATWVVSNLIICCYCDIIKLL